MKLTIEPLNRMHDSVQVDNNATRSRSESPHRVILLPSGSSFFVSTESPQLCTTISNKDLPWKNKIIIRYIF